MSFTTKGSNNVPRIVEHGLTNMHIKTTLIFDTMDQHLYVPFLIFPLLCKIIWMIYKNFIKHVHRIVYQPFILALAELHLLTDSCLIIEMQ